MTKKEIITVVLGVLCLGYGFMIYRIHTGSSFFLFWFALGILFFCLTLCLRFHIWSRLPKIVTRAMAGGVILVFALFLGIEGCIISGFGAKGKADLDYIVVLGAQVKKSGPSRVLRYRLDTAYDYLVENKDTVCIVSGGQGGNEPCTEAQGMYTYLVERGIAPERIVQEDTSVNTVENLTNSKAFLEGQDASVGIVTSNFHIFRSIHIARHLGMTNAVGIAAGSTRSYLPNNMVRECLGVLKDFLCGNLG